MARKLKDKPPEAPVTGKVIDQLVTDRYAVYNGDCVEAIKTIPNESVHLSIYSPPFYGQGAMNGLYVYSSSERDFSNSRNYEEFSTHYEFLIKEIHRITMPGRISAVHCMEVPTKGANLGGGLHDFPGDIIRMHERLGWTYFGRHCIWKEPLGVRNRTMAKGLAHAQIVDDSLLVDNAAADFLLLFRRDGENKIPVSHSVGLLDYAGERLMPAENLRFKGWTGSQLENKYSHWIWRQYASSFWDDIRIDNVLAYEEARDPDDEKHVHPLQLDVIERTVILRSNPNEVVFTPFMGVGSEVVGAIRNGRKAIGIELKPSYYRQAVKNLATALEKHEQDSFNFDGGGSEA